MKNKYLSHTIIGKFPKIFTLLLMFLSSIALLYGCSQNSDIEEVKELNEDTLYVYYVDNDETKLVEESYEVKSLTREAKVKELVRKLQEAPDEKSYKAIKSDYLKIDRYVFDEDNRLSIYFSSDYYKLDSITEVLYRAAIVKTLTQLEEIEIVEFYVSGLPLSFVADKVVGRMESDDFITGTGLENVIITVYYANEDGTSLVDIPLRILSVSDMSIEQLVISCILDGPSEEQQERGIKATTSQNTKLIKVSTKDGICYVDFSKEFLDKVEGVDDQVVIYSIVNSLVELQTVNKVQFTIEGEVKKMFRDKIPFDSFFERNLEIVEGAK